MKIKLSNGQLYIDGKAVMIVVFQDGTNKSFPNLNSNSIEIEEGSENTESTVIGNRNTVITGKNILSNTSIKCNGDFHLGDK